MRIGIVSRGAHHWRALYWLWFASIAPLMSIASCDRSQPDDERVVITLTVRTGPEADGLRAVARAFEKRESIDVRINGLGRDGYMTAMPTQLLSGTTGFDVAFVPSTLIAEFAEAGAIAPLDPYIEPDADLLASYGYAGKTYALPTDISVLFLYYRSDLIPEPPATWDQYLATARKFTKSLNAESPTIYGAALAGKGPEEPPKVFYSVMWSFGGFIIENGSVGLDNAGAIAAGQFYRRLAAEKVLSPDITAWSYPEVLEALKTGKVAMAAPMWNAAYVQIRDSESAYREAIKVALVPGVMQEDGTIHRVAFQHGWTLVLNDKSRHPKEAAKFIEFATGPEGGRVYALSGGGTPARRSLLGDSALQARRPEFALVLQSLAIAKGEPAVPFYAEMHATMNRAISSILLQKEPQPSALKLAAKKVRGLLRE